MGRLIVQLLGIGEVSKVFNCRRWERGEERGDQREGVVVRATLPMTLPVS